MNSWSGKCKIQVRSIVRVYPITSQSQFKKNYRATVPLKNEKVIYMKRNERISSRERGTYVHCTLYCTYSKGISRYAKAHICRAVHKLTVLQKLEYGPKLNSFSLTQWYRKSADPACWILRDWCTNLMTSKTLPALKVKGRLTNVIIKASHFTT